MQYELWHVRETALKEVMFGLGRKAKFPEELMLIALIEAEDPEDVFRKTQHLDEGPWWHQHSGVQILTDWWKVRSTSMGDAVREVGGKAYRYAFLGVEEIHPEDDLSKTGINVISDEEIAAKEGPFVVMCSRVSECAKHAIIKGSKQFDCDGCGEKVWMSPATLQAFLKMKKPIRLCQQCVGKRIDQEREAESGEGTDQGRSVSPS
jgi:hypothetical protein